ncbi:hypothetical protein ABCR94_24540 [Streptomyces sp. 21So2-11]|uniref:hypothetical protein n=1 Tax=Streptomyces sp. 21So2-11 TaxID=3144408 RepID=UPI00321BFEE0
MRLRHTLAAAAGAALLLAVPGSAYAAEGVFTYSYLGDDGSDQTGVLPSPESGVCITIPEAAVEYTSAPAEAPRNWTDSYATAFTGVDCSGDNFTMRPGGGASERLKLRSVIFF